MHIAQFFFKPLKFKDLFFIVATVSLINKMLYNRIPRCTSFYTLGASTAINLVLPAKQARHSLTGIVGGLENTALELIRL